MGTVAIIVAAILVGTVLQRISGTGVGLVVAPTLSILLGPVLGASMAKPAEKPINEPKVAR